MAGQTFSGSFPVNPVGATFVDGPPQSNERTPGGTVAFPLPIQPPMTQRWSVISWTISFLGAFTPDPGVGGFNGRLGKLIGGLLRGGVSIPPPINTTLGMSDLPEDTSLLTTLWDGASDTPFPTSSAAPILREPIIGGMSLPVPLMLQPGDQLSMGMWLTPSLVRTVGGDGAFYLDIHGPEWTVTIDDGQQPVAGWAGG